MRTIKQGERVQDILGHWYEVLATLNDWVFRVQPLTPIGSPAVLQPLGGPVTMRRSEMKEQFR